MNNANATVTTSSASDSWLDILEPLRRTALDRGANDAVIISSSDVIVDPRARFKCMIPKCYM
jgi:predicted metal-binding protein